MKRKRTYTILFFALAALFLAGCGSARTPANQENLPQQETDTDQLVTPDPEEAETPSSEMPDSESPDSDEAESPNLETPDSENNGTQNDTPTVPEIDDPFSIVEVDLSQLADMEKALDTIMLACLENDMVYDSQNPDFFWTALYYGIASHSKEVPLAEHVNGDIRVPRMAVQEFATGLFADYSDLPELPATISNVRYDADWDAYIFIPGDHGTLYARLLNAMENEDGSITAAAALYEEETDSPVSCATFRLVTNSFADGIQEPIFLHSVASMTPSPAVNGGGDLTTLIGSYRGFSDSHTVEFIIDGNLMAFQVYDRQVVSILKLFENETEVTFAVETDKETESRTIVSIIGK